MGAIEQALDEMPYVRGIVEKQLLPDGRRALRVWPVDGAEILTLEGRVVLCWNGLTPEEKRTLIDGNYGAPIDATHGPCLENASVMVETVYDETPGPRLYCRRCAVQYLTKGE